MRQVWRSRNLLHSMQGICGNADEALHFYAVQRTFDGKGITNPSQTRYFPQAPKFQMKLHASNHLSAAGAPVHLVVLARTNSTGACTIDHRGKQLLLVSPFSTLQVCSLLCNEPGQNAGAAPSQTESCQYRRPELAW